ncbi:hypothetical protein Leryth_025592 [Lithospermum erythrorhizon]|nr:hypothetical protein Leryth_025592 [Lithospermum erythrorhizon]
MGSQIANEPPEQLHHYDGATTSAAFNHPLATPADSDPLLSPHPPPPPTTTTPSINTNTSQSSDYYSQHNDENLPSSEIFIEAAPPKSNYLRISVSDPKKEGESSNSLVPGTKNTYVTYLITTETDLPDYNGSKFTVRRRFKDIVTLSDRLTESYRGFFIPPRPDKSVVESQVMQKHEFVEQRRVLLERYLRRLAGHPMVKKSDELRVFLQVEGRMPLPTSTDMASRMLDGAVNLPRQLMGSEGGRRMGLDDVVQPAKSGRDLMRMFRELKQTVVMDWGGKKPPVEEEDREFLEKKERLIQLELHLTNASKQAESLMKAQQEMGETLGELGLAFLKLTKFENEQTTSVTQRTRATDMKSIATAAVKAGRLYRGLNAQSMKHLDTIHEYMGFMLAVRSAFSDRSSALLTAQTLISELSSLHAKSEKLETASTNFFGGDKSRPRKMDELKEAIRVTEDAKYCALKEYERIKENNRNEIERLDIERKGDFMNMLKGFVTDQVAYAEKIETEWAKVAEETSRYAKESE